MNRKKTILAAKESFEQRFAEQKFYDRQTRDEQHLQQILLFLPLHPAMRILDLGTGSGFLAFALAQHCPDSEITGLDIVAQTLSVNRKKAAENELQNLRFVCYDGTDFPFADGAFDLVVSRYSLHHFPDPAHSIREVTRVLTADGSFFLSDPAPNLRDTERFVDAFMQMKQDGHVRFYTKADWKLLCGAAGLTLADSFDSMIRFPRKKEPAGAYEALLKQYPKTVTENYAVTESGDEIWITEQVNNLLFRKQAK